MKNTKIIISILMIICWIHILSNNLNAQKYTGNVHRYIVQEAYNLLKYEMNYAYDIYEDYFEFIKDGSEYEDHYDLVYLYGWPQNPYWQPLLDLFGIQAQNVPEFTEPSTLPPGWVEAYFSYCQPIGTASTVTHFWEGDNGPDTWSICSDEVELIGFIPITYTYTCENAMMKSSSYSDYNFTYPHVFDKTELVDCDVDNLCAATVGIAQILEWNWNNIRVKYFNTYGQLIGEWNVTDEARNKLNMDILGRMCHLLADMAVPAHVHCDPHPGGDANDSDSYEDWMENEDNWHWNFYNTYNEKGGLIDVSSETEPLFYLMYTVNQITDFFASDDVDGDNNLPQGSNSILDAMYTELEAQFPPDHPIRNAHEMTDAQCAQIRDVVLPFVIRATAGLLDWFAQEHNLSQYPFITSEMLEAYFYQYTNPVTDDTNKELSFYYLTDNTTNPEVRVTIEKENGETIWDNEIITLSHCYWNGNFLPFWNFAKRLLLEDDYTGPITIQVSEDGIVTKESTVNYNPSNKPPLPILFNWPDGEKGIYPTRYGNYTSGLYYNHSYKLKINAPYSGNIDTWYNITIEDNDNPQHIFYLDNTPYTHFNDNGEVDLTIPYKTDIVNAGLNGVITLKINKVQMWPNHHIIFSTDAFCGLIRTVSYPGIIMYCITESGGGGGGCPTLYYGNERENNIIPLGENQEQDCFDYTLLKNTVKNSEVIEMKVIEDQDNSNYFDLIQLVAVGHSKDTEVGVNNSNGEIFLYNPKSQIRFDTGKDSIFILQAEDSLLINLSDFNIPPVEYVYLKVTCSLLQNKASANPNKENFSIGEIASKDTTENIIDIVGLHETEFTSYSEINENDIDLSNGILLIKSSRDIEISEISVVLENNGKDDFEISNCNILKAISIHDNKNVLDYIRCDDSVYYEFGIDDGINLLFENPILNNETADYVFISKGRYIHNQSDEVGDLTYKLSNYPNPFSSSTIITFSNTKPSKNKKIEIYNIKGQLVKNFDLESEDSSIIWDGKDSNGVQVANGIYFYKLSCMNKSVVKKMILLR